MAGKKGSGNNKLNSNGKKKPSIGRGKYSKFGQAGGGQGGSTVGGNYRKKRRGQGKQR